MNHKNISKNEWSQIVCGLRKQLSLSQTELSKQINLCRQNIGRIERQQRTPNENSKTIILNFINKNNLNINKLKELGKNSLFLAKKREKSIPLKLKKSKELAELIGIILGDGEIRKDGSVRISFDPKKDKDFLYRKVFPLIKRNSKNKISFESEKRICFWNMAFVKYLKNDCNLNPGSKFENNWSIPKWCFQKKEYLTAVLRGLFDTDGYFAYHSRSVDLMFGRFSEKSTNLVKDMKNALIKLDMDPSIQQSNDGRYKVRLNSKKSILNFFQIVGTSNIKHVVRFILWRKHKYEAKIEIEGLDKLIRRSKVKINIELPFLWKDLQDFQDLIKEDETFLEGVKMRKSYKWSAVISNLISVYGSHKIAKELGVTERNVRKWKEGTRIPSPRFRVKLIKWRNNQ